jgi:hypothetical protein
MRKPRQRATVGAEAAREDGWRAPGLVSAVSKTVVISLVIVVLIVLAARSPQGLGHLVGLIFTLAAKLLNGVSMILNALLGGQAH